MVGAMSAATFAGDLSKYRNFELGSDLATVAKQTAADPSQAKVIHSRPALIQEREWRPQPLGPTAQTEPAQKVVFNFYDGELFRIVVDYDRYETEGLTAADLVDAISATYGLAGKPTTTAKIAPDTYGDQEDPRPMAGFAVPLRFDPFFVRTYFQAGWGHEAAGDVSRSRQSGSEASRQSGSAAKRCRPSSF
jgi:hypothetical protein